MTDSISICTVGKKEDEFQCSRCGETVKVGEMYQATGCHAKLCPKLIQLHYQDKQDLDKTEFVAQTKYTDNESLKKFLLEMYIKHPIPEGKMPLLCEIGSQFFIMTE